jgi:hypothetical protein
MTESLKLGGGDNGAPRIRRLNRLPVIVAILLVLIFLGVIFYGLSSRGLHFGSSSGDYVFDEPVQRRAMKGAWGRPISLNLSQIILP